MTMVGDSRLYRKRFPHKRVSKINNPYSGVVCLSDLHEGECFLFDNEVYMIVSNDIVIILREDSPPPSRLTIDLNPEGTGEARQWIVESMDSIPAVRLVDGVLFSFLKDSLVMGVAIEIDIKSRVDKNA